MKHLLTLSLIVVTTSPLHAHHTGWRAASKSLKCGWLEGSNVHDATNLRTFCFRWIPAAVQIEGAAANREYLWIDASPDLAASLWNHEAATAALLKDWLDGWKAITGYRTATVVVLRRDHLEIARAGTGTRGEFVMIR